MDNETELVFRGFLNLNSSQRAEMIHAINTFQEAASPERERLVREANEVLKVYLGPTGRVCKCCGR